MRAWLVVALALGACARPTPPPSPVPPTAPAVEARPTERVMRERIAFEPSEKGGPPPGVAVEELGRLPGKGRWIALHDDALDAYEKAGNRLPLLYFSRDAYQKAIRKLTGPQIEEAMAARLQYWSPKAMNEAPRLLYRAQRDLLMKVAEAARLAPMPAQLELRGIFERTLDRLAEWGEGWAFKGQPLAEILSAVHQDDVELIADAASIVAEAPPTAPIVADAIAHRAYVAAYDELRALPMSLMLLQVHVHRVFYLAPVPAGYVEWLRHEGDHFRLWNAGVVRPATRRSFQLLLAQAPKSKLELAGFSQGRFYEDALDVTAAQAEVALAETIEWVRARPLDAAREHWVQTTLRVALRRRCLLGAAEREASPFKTLIAAHVAEETGLLQHMLALVSTGSTDDALVQVEHGLAVAGADASFAAQRCVVENRQEAAEYAQLHGAFEQERKRARALVEGRR